MDRDVMDPESAHSRDASEALHIPETIARALETKRKQLDEEVEHFKAEKEEEYKEFEELLRQEARKELSNGRPVTEASSPSVKSGTQFDSAQPNPQPRESSSDRRAAKKTRTARQALDQAFRHSNNSVDIRKGDQHSREWEGVFTPQYLALIDGEGNQQRAAAEASNASSRLTHRRPEQVSSSADIHPPLLPLFVSSPIEASPVSSSAPTHTSPVKAHHRSDSANSNLSVSSLRSSMKDPKIPKSPKRVLFSIEAGVVSPSTSPTLDRKVNGEETNGANEGEGVDSALALGKRSSRDRKKKNRRKERGDGDRGRRSRDDLDEIGVSEARGFTNLTSGWTKSFPIAPSQPLSVNGNTPATTSSSDDYERIEKADDDDLFAFDEDLTSSSSNKANGEQETHHDFSDDENDTKIKDPLTGTSPHAGSLPIEIKWPGRRDSGG